MVGDFERWPMLPVRKTDVDVDDEDTSFLRTVGGDHVVVYHEVDEG